MGVTTQPAIQPSSPVTQLTCGADFFEDNFQGAEREQANKREARAELSANQSCEREK